MSKDISDGASDKPGVGATADAAGDRATEVRPHHIIGFGGGVVAIGALLSATATYRSGTKGLVEDGIDPSTRVRIIPLAARTLGLSTLMTGLFGALGFYVLKENGFFKSDIAELPSAKEAARIMRNPVAYVREVTRSESGGAGQSPPVKN